MRSTGYVSPFKQDALGFKQLWLVCCSFVRFSCCCVSLCCVSLHHKCPHRETNENTFLLLYFTTMNNCNLFYDKLIFSRKTIHLTHQLHQLHSRDLQHITKCITVLVLLLYSLGQLWKVDAWLVIQGQYFPLVLTQITHSFSRALQTEQVWTVFINGGQEIILLSLCYSSSLVHFGAQILLNLFVLTMLVRMICNIK